MKIALANDHAGFPLREVVFTTAKALGHTLVDFGTDTAAPCDYPDLVVPAMQAVQRGECDLGILICGTGLGMSIAANKLRGIYAAHCHDVYSARMAREHNAANVLTMGGRVLGPGPAAEVIAVFLTATPADGERYHRRQEKVCQIESQQL